MTSTSDYFSTMDRPCLSVDCVVFGFALHETSLKLMLIRRGIEPYKNHWALPGGFVHINESIESAAKRELHEEAGLKDIFLEQLYTFGALDRDPRGRVISVAYMAFVKPSDHEARASTDASDAQWFTIDNLPELAFDHNSILETGLKRLRGKLRYQPIGFELLPEKFTMSQLQHLYEVILDMPIDKRNFQRKIHKMGLLLDTGEQQQNVAHRAAKFYKFNWERYQQLEREGFEFAL